jgi:hypothetical protein
MSVSAPAVRQRPRQQQRRVTVRPEAAVRTRVGRHGVYDVTVRRGDEVIAEFRGRSTGLPPPP